MQIKFVIDAWSEDHNDYIKVTFITEPEFSAPVKMKIDGISTICSFTKRDLNNLVERL